MNNIFKFYIFNSKLKHKLRQGWIDVKISDERIESVAEHIYGTLVLAISINDEYKLGLNMEHILKMMTLHELEEIIIPDYSALASITKEEKLRIGRLAVKKVVEGLIKEEEIIDLLDEFNERKTKEAKFCYHIDKLEADLQAKLYDLEGHFDLESEKVDCRSWYGEKAEDIIASSTCASDIWLKCDSYIYEDDELFSKLQKAIMDIKKCDFDEIVNS